MKKIVFTVIAMTITGIAGAQGIPVAGPYYSSDEFVRIAQQMTVFAGQTMEMAKERNRTSCIAGAERFPANQNIDVVFAPASASPKTYVATCHEGDKSSNSAAAWALHEKRGAPDPTASSPARE